MKLIMENWRKFLKRKLGTSWGEMGDIVRGTAVIDYLQDNSYFTDESLKEFRRSKFKLKYISIEDAKKHRQFTIKHAGPGTEIDPWKMDRLRGSKDHGLRHNPKVKGKFNFETMIEYPPVIEKHGFILDGNHRTQWAIEEGLPEIPVLMEM